MSDARRPGPGPAREVVFSTLALGGEAVGRPAPGPGGPQPVVFAPYGAPGDRALVMVEQAKPRYARGWIKTLITPSPDRVEPPCPYFFRPGRDRHQVCGGCDWQHVTPARQRSAKHDLLVETFQRIGRIARPAVDPVIGPAGPEGDLRYRNKALIPFAPGPDGRPVGGFYAPGTHRVVPINDCLIQTPQAGDVFRQTRDWLGHRRVSVYNPATGKGWLRHLLVRTAQTGHTMAALVTRPGTVPGGFADHLRRRCPHVVSVFQNVNGQSDNTVLGPRWVLLSGAPTLEERFLNLRFRLSPGVFFQVNHAMAEVLVRQAVTLAAAGPDDVVWELYAGVGAMGQCLARRAKRVWAVEENPAAVADGIDSLTQNHVANMRFVKGPCRQVLAGRALKDAPAVVLLDPPRAGCERGTLQSILRAGPRRIVYVSCDPGTLARDAHYLATGGYHLVRCVPVDLFPQTAHIESVSLFQPAGRRE